MISLIGLRSLLSNYAYNMYGDIDITYVYFLHKKIEKNNSRIKFYILNFANQSTNLKLHGDTIMIQMFCKIMVDAS